jgi:hypothetical protein
MTVSRIALALLFPGERLRGEVDLPTIGRDARATVEAAVLPTRIGVWLCRGSGETT